MKSAVVLTSMIFLSGCGCEQIETGHRGIKSRFGDIEGKPLESGLHWYNPLTEKIRELNVQEQKIEGDALSFTRDTQTVNVSFAVTLFPDPNKIDQIYREYGEDWSLKVVPQAIQNSIKDTVGQYIADDLVGKRDEARGKAEAETQRILASRNITLTRLDFVNLDFDDAYEKAVEAKVVAVQKASEAKNRTVEVEEKARQQVIAAEAEAKSMQIRSQALSQNKGLVEWEAVQKWNGQLPQYMLSGGSVPFINIKKD